MLRVHNSEEQLSFLGYIWKLLHSICNILICNSVAVCRVDLRFLRNIRLLLLVRLHAHVECLCVRLPTVPACSCASVNSRSSFRDIRSPKIYP